MTQTFFYFAALGASAFVLFLWWKNVKKQEAQFQALFQQMQNQLQTALRENTSQSREELKFLSRQLNERMKETSSALHNTQSNIGDRLDRASTVIGHLQQKLGSLEESSKRIFEVGQGLKDLKDIMQNPKMRGSMGEFFLEDLLRQILPAKHYAIQHRFQSGEVVDAIIQLGEAIVPVDSKFPLESFVRLLQIPADEEEKRRKEKKGFIQAIKRHADAISQKYILPHEGTFDFAFMYIPAENIYYETIIQEDVMEEGALYPYLLNKRVIPVSPNSLYAYLQVITLGLKGLKIQESARQIFQNLNKLSSEFEKFKDDYTVLGKHLKNANNTFDSSNKRLDRFQIKLDSLSDANTDKEALIEPQENVV